MATFPLAARPVVLVYISRNVWVSPSGIFTKVHVDFIRAVVGLDRIIWAVDYPFLDLDGTRAFLDELDMDEAEMRQITHENAERLFKLPVSSSEELV